LLTRKNVKPSV